VVTTDEPLERLGDVGAETEARCPVMNLLVDAKWISRWNGSATAPTVWSRCPDLEQV
jgi:hypothetical protein